MIRKLEIGDREQFRLERYRGAKNRFGEIALWPQFLLPRRLGLPLFFQT
jgi:hypothetical protein